MASIRICTIPGCGNPMRARTWCIKHYWRWKKHGDPLAIMISEKGAGPKFLDEVVMPFEGDDCLLWPYGKHRFGYGMVNLNGRSFLVHVLACEHANGPKPTPEHEVAHSCGSGHKGCVNPRHLRWATRVENSADKVRHGTARKGAQHPHAKLTERQVCEIRALAGVIPQRVIAERYGVSIGAIGLINARLRWKTIR